MKRTAALFFMLILCLHVCGCGQQQSYTDYTAYLAPDNAGMGTTGAPPAMQFAGAEDGTKEQEGDPALSLPLPQHQRRHLSRCRR